LIAALGIKPSRGNFKVAIIDDAETLNIPAQNSLLKTLEEPPGQALILMVTAAERLLLDTVRSRMRLVHFGALSVSDLEEILARRGVPETVREGAARLARGSAARALALAEGAEPPVKQLLGALGQARGLDFTGIQKIAQEYFQNRDQAADNFELIARLLEEILWSKLNGPDASGDGESKAIADLAGSMALDAVVKCLEGAVKARTAVDAMANPRLQAEQYWMMTAQALRSE